MRRIFRPISSIAAIAAVLACSPMALANSNPEPMQTSLMADNTINVIGTVVDENDEPLIGVSVVVDGTKVGATTDIDGRFSLPMSPKATLVVSYVGYDQMKVDVKGRTSLTIKLTPNHNALDEVVVVGYGTQKRANLTGAVSAVTSEDLGNRALTSVAAGLQGTMPGVTIKSESGRPGMDDGGTSIRVRGTGTFNNSAPMVIVDGMESTMYDLDPNDIESISVLKDAASASIYGSKAANGVIVITTKRGQEGPAKVTYASTYGWQRATRLTEYVNSADYAILTNEARANEGYDPMYTSEDIELFRNGTDPYGHANTDWYDLLFRGNGFQTTQNISINGGTQAMRYMISLGYTKQNGIIKNMGKDKYNVRVNLDGKISKRLEASTSIAYTREDVVNPVSPKGDWTQYFYLLTKLSPMVVNQYPNGDYGYIGDGNPIAWMDSNSTSKQMRNNLQMVGSLKFFILPELSVKGIAAYKFYYGETHDFRKRVRYNDTYTHGDTDNLTESDYRDDRLSGDILVEYRKTFGKAHNFYAMVGYHAELFRTRSLSAYREGFPSTTVTDLNAGGTKNMSNSGNTNELSMMSWFGRVTYDYEGKYLFEANLRYDGTSRFARGKRWGAFPSFSAGWRFSEESFFQPISHVVTNAKLRASWGKLGNQDIAGWYPTVSTISLGYNYPFGGSIYQGAVTRNAANQRLVWESTTSTDVGLDVSIFGKLNIVMDYYLKYTNGILMSVATPVNYALANYYDNVGKVRNTGFEFGATWNDRVGNVSYNIGANFAYNKNRIVSMGPGGDLIGDNNIMREGEPLNSFYGYKTDGFFQSEEEIAAAYPNGNIQLSGRDPKPGDIKYVDANGDGRLDANDRCVLGQWDPKFTFGFSLGAEWMGFDINAVFQGVAGVNGYITREGVGYVNGDTSKPTTLWLDHWTPENRNAATPRLIQGMEGWSMPTTVSDFWMQNANYLRMKTLQVGYTLPKSVLNKIRIANIRIFYTGENLLTFTKFMKGYDPETPVGQGNIYPQTKVNSFGINITF